MLPVGDGADVSGQVVAAVAETGDQRFGVGHQPALPVPPQRARTPSTRRELDLHAAAGRQVHRVGGVHAAQVGWDALELGDDVVRGQLRSEVPGDMVGELAVAAAE